MPEGFGPFFTPFRGRISEACCTVRKSSDEKKRGRCSGHRLLFPSNVLPSSYLVLLAASTR